MSQIHSKCIITREWLVGHWRDAVHAYVAPAEAVPKLQEPRLLYGTSVDRRKFRLQAWPAQRAPNTENWTPALRP